MKTASLAIDRILSRILISTVILIMLSGCTPSEDQSASRVSAVPQTRAQAAVASAHPLATEAGIDVLRRGGNAFDAAVAVTAALAVVEPYSSGIGGGGFYLLHEASSDRYQMIDARETAPSAAHRDMYLDSSGQIMPGASIDGPLAAGIPGIPAALVYLAENFGELELGDSMAAAIRYARTGFPVDYYYQRMASFRLQSLRKNQQASDIFLLKGEVPPVGHDIVQRDLATTLELIADKGVAGFYQGDLARMMVDDVRSNGGIWQLSDLEDYQLKMREPVVFDYRGMKLITASLPSSGGVVLAQVLGMLEQFDIDTMEQSQRIHHIVEAMRRAYRDRAEFLGDTDFVEVPVKRLTSKSHAMALAETISAKEATPSMMLDGYTEPAGDGNDTTHFSIIDRDGNKVSATLSINYPFGASYVAAGTGVLLNDEMDDFASKPGEPNVYGLVGTDANAIEPGKRMLSSMTPTIAETDSRIAIIGTPGGSRIITMVLLGLLDFHKGEDAEAIVGAGRYHHQFLPDRIVYEPGALDEGVSSSLRSLGHDMHEMDDSYGNMQLLILDKRSGEVDAASDPRVLGRSAVLH